MDYLNHLSFGFSRKLPVLLQAESVECGLACIGMIAGFHGLKVDMATLRKDHAISQKGANLAQLIEIAGRISMGARALRVELDGLASVQLPCILHWNFNHFVVLKSVGRRHLVIHDPATGARRLSMEEASRQFTGIVLELWTTPAFKPETRVQAIRLAHLTGQVSGMFGVGSQVLMLALALEVCILVGPFLLQWVVDDVVVAADRDLLATLAIGFGLLALIQNGIAAMRSWVVMAMASSISIQWRANVFSHLLRLPMQYFEKRSVGDVMSRFGAIDQIQHTLTNAFLEALLDGLMAVVTLVMMFVFSVTLGWVALLALLLYLLLRSGMYGPLRNAAEEHIAHGAKQQTHFLETLRGVKTVKLYQRHDERRAVWLALLVNQLNADLRGQRLRILYKLFNGTLSGLVHILVLWVGAHMVMEGRFTVGVLMAFLAYRSQFDQRVTALIDKLFEVKMLKLQGERLADIVLAETEPYASFRRSAAPLDASIEVRELGFRYSPQEPYVMRNISFRIDAGESVAIVGPSGCGKTTLLNILLGILPPTEGEVLLGDFPISQLGTECLHRAIGTVLQDDALFAGSIADNISFFDPRPDQEWIEQCAYYAAIALDIVAMPMAYNTLVGDMGAALSGGQKQRILLARALYKRPRILFLDEATSHLDILREKQVNAAIKALQITRVIVAHRPETIASADRVIVLAGAVAGCAAPVTAARTAAA